MNKNILGIELPSIYNAQTIPSSSKNYVYARTCLQMNCVKQSESTQYFDGVGGPKHVVNVKSMLGGKDIGTHSAYYSIGRHVLDYLFASQSGTSNELLSGSREYYSYDTANRLESVKDVNGNTLKEYQYHYKP